MEECFIDLTTQYIISTTSGLSVKAVKARQGMFICIAQFRQLKSNLQELTNYKKDINNFI